MSNKEFQAFDKDVQANGAYASRKLPEYMHHRLLCCNRCDVIYASPVPDTSELESAYKAAAYDSQREAATSAGGCRLTICCRNNLVQSISDFLLDQVVSFSAGSQVSFIVVAENQWHRWSPSEIARR